MARPKNQLGRNNINLEFNEEVIFDIFHVLFKFSKNKPIKKAQFQMKLGFFNLYNLAITSQYLPLWFL